MPVSANGSLLHLAGTIGSLDPRVRLSVAVLLIVFVNLVPVGSWWVYCTLQAGLFLISRLSGLALLHLVKRSLMAAPFVLAALAIPFTTAGVPLFSVPGVNWTVTDTGLTLFVSILLRFWLAVQVAVLLEALTRISDLLWALRELHVPAVLVGVISVMYRYSRLLVSEANRMSRARAARSCILEGGRRPSLAWRGRVTGTMIGSLFLRAVSRSERIHLAMLSRAYDGTPRLLTGFRMDTTDWSVLAGFTFLALVFGWWLW